jgi:hypothetical protein
MHAAQCKFLIQFSKQLIPDARPQSRGAMRPSLANRSPRKKRAQGMPGARCTRSLACEIKKHTSVVTTVTPVSPGIPRAMVLRLISRSPRRSGLFVTVVSRVFSQDLTPASRRQNHTTSPSASSALVSGAACVHRIPCPTSVTIAKRPSVGAGRCESVN